MNTQNGFGALVAGMLAMGLVYLSAHAHSDWDETELIGAPQLEWEEQEIPEPFADFEQAIGFYSNGQLANASHLEDEGFGFLKIARPRDRGWGTEELIALLKDTAATLAQHYPDGERLQIADLSRRQGGRITLHSSHQNGLDADLAYLRVNGFEQDPHSTQGFVESFVHGGKVSANFDVERNWAMMRSFVASGQINRIFVDGAIKRLFCRQFLSDDAESIETLRRLRPISNHADHLHIRIECPQSSPRCRAQTPPPPGSGC